jgi:hypothetical protein
MYLIVCICWIQYIEYTDLKTQGIVKFKIVFTMFTRESRIAVPLQGIQSLGELIRFYL